MLLFFIQTTYKANGRYKETCHFSEKKTVTCYSWPIWNLTTWKSDLPDKIKQEFFQAVDVSVLLYGCTTEMKSKMGITQDCYLQFWTNLGCTLYKTAAIWPFIFHHINHPRRTRHAGQCYRCNDKLIISDVLL